MRIRRADPARGRGRLVRRFVLVDEDLFRLLVTVRVDRRDRERATGITGVGVEVEVRLLPEAARLGRSIKVRERIVADRIDIDRRIVILGEAGELPQSQSSPVALAKP